MAGKKRLAKATMISYIFDKAEEDAEREAEIQEKRRTRSVWVKPWLMARETRDYTVYPGIEEDPVKFKESFRMNQDMFEFILSRIKDKISKQTTSMRTPIPARLRLQVTLRFLAAGCSFKVLEEAFRISYSAISMIVPEVCDAIWSELSAEQIKCPQSEEEWLTKAKAFETKWDYPFGLGALDGKHCLVKAYGNSGSLFYSYKQSFSIVLLALADADYKFIYVDIGAPGSGNDAGVMQVSSLNEALRSGALNLPSLPHYIGVEYHLIGDDAFGFTTRLVKPYPSRGLTAEQRIFNYRLSRARRVVENAFGIKSSKFRILRTPNHQSYDNCVKTIKATTVLHNLLLEKHELPDGFMEETTSTFGQPVVSLPGNRVGNREARVQRDKMAKYFFSGDGQTHFQWSKAFHP
ncbi:uncharacterized protein LOC131889133 [Tigriopus californicus]|uniref:uncharacterized protein LOC131889133 n=1 Tax=Tigriopus californicus TaxID=6832 RepID=UPI0027DAA072|nr:uncharacterized protein LOC131889133 [Tigriopus californicus]